MNVRVALSRSLGAADGLDALARIVQAIGDGWHEWLGPDPDEESLTMYFDQYRAHRELVEKSFTRASLYPLESRRTIVVAEDEDVATSLPDRLAEETIVAAASAAILLTQPLEILVEHEVNDGDFYLRLIRIVDEALVRLFSEARPCIRFQNGGGNTVAATLVHRRAESSRAAGVPLRMLVLADSDARFPGHQERATGKLKNACDETGASLFILEKRAIENYVTDPVLSEMAAQNRDVAPSVAFILALPPTARDHYPIKAGIASVDGKADLPEGPEKQMYNGIEFPADFKPKLGNSAAQFIATSHIHAEQDLIERDCLHEVQTIARWMREEL